MMESKILEILEHKRFKNFNPIIARGIDTPEDLEKANEIFKSNL